MKARRLTIALVALLLVLAAAAAIYFVQGSVAKVETARFAFPKNVGSILVLADRFPDQAAFAEKRAKMVAIGLRYFSPNTSWSYIDAAPESSIRNASVVVFLGFNGLVPLSPENIAKLKLARRLIVSEHHIREIHNAGVAFNNVNVGLDTFMPAGVQVSYGDFKAPLDFEQFLVLRVGAPARTAAQFTWPNGSKDPYIVVDGNAMFINGPISFIAADGLHGDMLPACDAIASFLGATPNLKPLAMLRLEDVSSITSAVRMGTIAYYLWRAHVPYGIGVIPDLRIQSGGGGSLASNPQLVAVLKWAQGHGATIILHGLHHCCSSADSEGYEFWNFDRKTPVPADSAEWMSAQISEGLKDEHALGLNPVMWETPHYAASTVDYTVASHYFPVAWERRAPTSWLPWPLQRDQYGSMILPENLGYVSLDGAHTVKDQLAKAQAMLACRYCVAVGFLHPALLNVNTIDEYVQGLRKLGYSFVDPMQAMQAARE